MRRVFFSFLIVALAASGIILPSGLNGADDTISLNFEDVALGTVLTIMSRKTGRKFITDNQLAQKKIFIDISNVTADEALTALLNMYNLYYVRQGETNIYVIKSKTEGELTTVSKIFYCNYATAQELSGVIAPKLSKGGNISADVRTNSLIVTDMADNIDQIGTLITVLDTPTPQVLLEARIVDVKLDSFLKIGVDIYNLYKTGEYYQNPLNAAAAQIPEKNFTSSLSHGLGSGGKFTGGVISRDYNIEGLIEALRSETDAKVLSNPKLLVLNNREANIDIVDEIPYQERTQSTEGQEMVSTSFKQVGVKMQVKPQINRDQSIILTVSPEQSFRTGESISNTPIINTSRTHTTFMLRNGETAVIGGLIRETDSKTELKVPLLGDIPILGYLFTKYDRTKARSELTIFITANIVD